MLEPTFWVPCECVKQSTMLVGVYKVREAGKAINQGHQTQERLVS